jgi:hypothetical protein
MASMPSCTLVAMSPPMTVAVTVAADRAAKPDLAGTAPDPSRIDLRRMRAAPTARPTFDSQSPPLIAKARIQ